jgi:hypothetical protein
MDDVNTAHVVWKSSKLHEEHLEKFNEIIDLYNIKQLRLNIRTDEVWESFKSKTKLVAFNGSFTWDVPRIPCLKYDYQIIIPPYFSKGITKCFATKVKSLQPSTVEEIRTSRYTPEPPQDLVVFPGQETGKGVWSKSKCAAEYEVYCLDTTNDSKVLHYETITENNEHGNLSVVFSNLKSCMKYEVDIYPKVAGGEVDSNVYAKESFYAKPESEALQKLQLKNIISGNNSIRVNFPTFQDEVMCLENYTIETCDKNKDTCFQTLNITQNSGDFVTYQVNELKSCTKYYIKIQSSYPGVVLTSKSVPAITKFDAFKNNVTVHFKPCQNNVEISIDNIDCVESYIIKYRLADGGNAWMEQHDTMEGETITIDSLHPNNLYEISMVGVTSSASTGQTNFTVFQQLEFRTCKY